MTAAKPAGRVYTMHIPPRATDFSRIDAIPDQVSFVERVFAAILPIVWLIVRRHWAVLIIALVIVTPLTILQVDHNTINLVDAEGQPLGPDDTVKVSTASEGRFPYVAATQLVVFTIMIICAVFPAQVGRLDRDLRRWRHMGYVTAKSARDAQETWRVDPANLAVFDPIDDNDEGARQ